MADSKRLRELTIIAHVRKFEGRKEGKSQLENLVTARIKVPAEELWPGPMGYRVHVIDYDTTTETLYKAFKGNLEGDPFENCNPDQLLEDPKFHQQNVYAIVMATLGKFEAALGRRVNWGFSGRCHQLKIAPHAFRDANAFYSPSDEALLFGYFKRSDGKDSRTGNANGNGKKKEGSEKNKYIYTCLSHDIVVHETTHALLDGLRPHFLTPSSLDQAGFHEGFADVVAILSVFSLPEVLEAAFKQADGEGVTNVNADVESLRKNVIMKIGMEMADGLDSIRGKALRESAEIDPSEARCHPERYDTPHDRGEILVAAILRAFVQIWSKRIKKLNEKAGYTDQKDDNNEKKLLADRMRVINEGTAIADRLLTAAIRAIDYTPPVDLLFEDYLSALLTADLRVNPEDHDGMRKTLMRVFAEYGIQPASHSELGKGMWQPAREDLASTGLHFESLRHDPNEVFRFVWENRAKLDIFETYAFVPAVRPSLRIDEDGLPVRETVSNYIQVLTLNAGELPQVNLAKPCSCPDSEKVKLYGGGALIFDEFGKLRFHIQNKLNGSRQQDRIDYLWETGGSLSASPVRNLSEFHRSRSKGGQQYLRERW